MKAAFALACIAALFVSASALNPIKMALDKAIPAIKAQFGSRKLRAARGDRRLSMDGSCTPSDAHAKNLVVEITPSDPKIGETYTLHTIYDLDETVTGGTAKYKASFDGFPVVNESDDLCSTLEGGDSPCPVSGHVDSSATDEVPSDTPSGTLKGTIAWSDQNGEPILCLAYTFKV